MNNNQATLQKLNQMKLYGMARAYTTSIDVGGKNHFTLDEFLSHLVDAEWDDRHNRRVSGTMSQLRFALHYMRKQG
jgi:hypothetical protein